MAVAHSTEKRYILRSDSYSPPASTVQCVLRKTSKQYKKLEEENRLLQERVASLEGMNTRLKEHARDVKYASACPDLTDPQMAEKVIELQHGDIQYTLELGQRLYGFLINQQYGSGLQLCKMELDIIPTPFFRSGREIDEREKILVNYRDIFVKCINSR